MDYGNEIMDMDIVIEFGLFTSVGYYWEIEFGNWRGYSLGLKKIINKSKNLWGHLTPFGSARVISSMDESNTLTGHVGSPNPPCGKL